MSGSPEIIPPERGVQIVAVPNQLRAAERLIEIIPPGETILEILLRLGLGKLGAAALRVRINGSAVRAEFYACVRPKAGTHVLIYCPLHGGGEGGSNVGQMVAMIGLMLVAPWLGGVVGGFIAGALKLGAGWATAISAVATTAIGIAGSVAINSIFAPDRPSLGQLSGSRKKESPTLLINGARNQANLYGVIPVIYGTHRMIPPYGAQPYTETESQKQYLRCLFVIGHGPVLIEDMRIGSTPIEDFEGVDVEVFPGLDFDRAATIYTNNNVQADYQIRLTYDDEDQTVIVRTCPANAIELFFDISFPRGLLTIQALDGEWKRHSVGVRIELSPTGEDDWDTVFDEVIDAKQTERYVKSVRIKDLDPAVQYDARLRRTTLEFSGGEGEDTVLEETYLTAIRAVQDFEPINLAGLAKVALRIKASDQLNGTVDQFNCKVTRLTATTDIAELQLGAGSYVQSVKSFTRGDANPRTVEFWAYTYGRGTAGGGPFFSTGQRIPGRKSDFSLALDPDSGTDYVRVWIGDGASTSIQVTGFTLNEWHHWALAYDGTTVRLYFNGALAGSFAAVLESESTKFLLNRWVNSDGDSLHGRNRFREVRYWRENRTLSEITTNMNLYKEASTNLRMCWRCLEGVGSALVDYSGYGNMGTISGNNVTWEATELDPITVYAADPSPVAAFRDILQGPGIKQPLADDRIDLTRLATWRTFCTSKGYEYNAVIDFPGTVAERLRAVASAGRAALTMNDSKFSVVIDQPVSTPVQHITPGNSRNFTSRKTFIEHPHALKCRFVNRDADWQQDERIVYADDYDASNATLFEEMEFPGVTDADHVYRLARYNMAQALLRPETYELDMDVEHIVCQRGDLVEVTHDVILAGLGWGRITGLQVNSSGDVVAIECSEEFSLDAAKLYAVTIRSRAGTIYSNLYVRTVAGKRRVLKFVSAQDIDIYEGDQMSLGERGSVTQQMLVKAIIPNEDLSAHLILHDYSAGVFTADSEEIPAYSPNVTLDRPEWRVPPPPVIYEVVSDERACRLMPDGSWDINALVQWYYTSGQYEPVDRAQLQYRLDGYDWRTLEVEGSRTHMLVDDVRLGLRYGFRVRTISILGQYSDWSDTFWHTIEGPPPPPAPPFFDAVRLAGGITRFSWSLGSVPVGTIARIYMTTLYGDRDLEDNFRLLGQNLQGTTWDYLGLPPGSYSFALVGVNSLGNESDPIFIDRNWAPVANESLWFDAKEPNHPGWPVWNGTITGGSIDADNNLVGNFDGTWDAQGTWTATPNWLAGSSGPLTFALVQIDVADYIGGTTHDFTWGIAYSTDGNSGGLLFEERHSDDGVSWSTWTEHNWQTITSRYLEVRLTVTPDPGELPKITQFILQIIIL